jgi:tripartite ATP-independent transporter DctM subunit
MLILLVLLGLPIFIGFFAAAVLGLSSNQIDLAAIVIEVFRLANAPILVAVPLFTFAGYLLSEGGTSARLVRFSRSLLGWLPGGLGVVALVSCAFFTAITGATGITIIALGGLLLPALLSEHYKEDFSLGLITSSGSLGIHFPPSLPIILFGFVSGASIEKLFVAGILPGLLIVGSLGLFSVVMGKKWQLPRTSFSAKEFFSALKEAIWEILIPILILIAIFSGFSTATEAASLTVVYVICVKTLIFCELNLIRDLPRIMLSSMKMMGTIMILLGAALGFTNYLVDALIPAKILALMESTVQNKLAFLMILNLFLILVGCVMEIFGAILVVVPLIMPLAQRFGIDPIQLGMIFLTNLGIAYNTPPLGLNFFIASSRFEKPVVKLYKATLPFFLLLFVDLILITYWPGLSLFLPSFLKIH